MSYNAENFAEISLTIARISLIIAAISLVFNALNTLFSYLQLGNKKKRILEIIKKYNWVIMFSAIVFLSGALISQLYLNNLNKKIPNPEEQPKDFNVPVPDKKPLLVFAGGGSVANMIKDITKGYVDIKNYNNSIYLDLPSTNAWSLMAEEVMINHTSDSITNKFYPVCLSAIEANDSVFHKMVSFDEFTTKGTVISYYLGEDILKIYTNKKEGIGEKDKISIRELAKKVKEWCADKTVDVYITQEGSGTYLTYQNLFKDTVLLNKEDTFDIDKCKGGLKWYDTKTRHRTLTGNNREFLLLTCGYYTPEDIIGKYEPKKVVMNESETPITKSMYLYFAGYRDKKDDILIPEEMSAFLKSLKRTKKDAISINKNIMYQFKTQIITPLDTLIIWDEKYNNKSK